MALLEASYSTSGGRIANGSRYLQARTRFSWFNEEDVTNDFMASREQPVDQEREAM